MFGMNTIFFGGARDPIWDKSVTGEVPQTARHDVVVRDMKHSSDDGAKPVKVSKAPKSVMDKVESQKASTPH